MQLIDWILVVVPIAFVLAIALYTRRFVRSVADFLAGGRCAGRYLIANAFGESAAGVANTMSKFEVIMVSGFTVTFWNALSAPVLLIVAASGFVIYRYRETRALTLAQFFEMRYSRRFRLFMGMLAFGAGILNYGIFPAVSSRFFVYFLGLPEHVAIFGHFVPTFALIMASYLTCTLAMLMTGGQITLMVSDCVEGIFSLAILLVVMVAVLMTVHWHHVVEALGNSPPGESMLDPFNAWKLPDFNLSYVIMSVVLAVYGTMALQNTQGFNAAARDPNESRMAAILGNWRLNVRIMLLLGITTAAVAFLRHPAFATASAPANQLIASINNPQIQKQMTIAAALRYLLPVGIKGLFCSMMVMGLIAGDCSHIHSWASIFVQDVVLPMRKKPLTTRQHLLLLRLALLGVALFAFIFSLLFTQTHYIALWWQITNAIFISGAGAAIIGGLYWKRGTTLGAWIAVIVGAILSFTGIILHQKSPKFSLNGIQVAMLSAAVSAIGYVLISLLTCRRAFDLDALLHRNQRQIDDKPALRLSPSDRRIARGLIGWTILLALTSAIAIAANIFFGRWSVSTWGRFWFIFGIAVPFAVGTVTLVWFGLGAARDMRDFFHTLKTMKRDFADDGRVKPTTTESPVAMK